MNAKQMQEVVDVCKMLGDPTRLAIIEILARGAKSVGALCEKLDLPQPTTSHHLALLRMSGIVKREQKGKRRMYSLEHTRLTPVKMFLAKLK